MQKHSLQWIAVFLILSGSLFLASCGSDNDDDGSQTTSQTSATTKEVIDRVLEILFGDRGTTQAQGQTSATRSGVLTNVPMRQQSKTISETVECDVSQLSFTGEVDIQPDDTGTLSGALDFDNCEGINGTLSVFASVTNITDTGFDFSLTLDDDISAEGCTITFVGFSVSSTLSSTVADPSGSFTEPILINGALDATCDGDSIACTFNNIDVENQEAFENSWQAA